MSASRPVNIQKQQAPTSPLSQSNSKSKHLSQLQTTPLMTLDSIGYQVSGHSNVGRHTWCSRVNWLSGARSAQQKNGQHKSHTKHSYTSDASTPQKVLLTNINLKIMPNEKISVIGPNGAGKSTLMKLMLGLISPTSGRISCHPDLKVGYVPQKFSIPPILPLRVQDLLAQTKSRLSTDELDFLYQYLSISPLLAKQVIHLSGGETQRVLLARSFLAKPNLLILDEPMQGLDPESERWLYEFIDDLPDFLQCAMVVVSHDLHWVMRGSRRVICLNKHICCEGQPSTIGTSQEFQKLFGHQYVQPYIHQPHHCQHLDPHLH